MKFTIWFVAFVSIILSATAEADQFAALAQQGYRWIIVNGPYACYTEKDAGRIMAHHDDSTELGVVEKIQCHYLVPGTIARVIKEDPSRSMAEVQFASLSRPIWTDRKFLSKRPVRDSFGVIETPENSGFLSIPVDHSKTSSTGAAPQRSSN